MTTSGAFRNRCCQIQRGFPTQQVIEKLIKAVPLLTYLATATDALDEDNINQALAAALPEAEKTLMPTLAQQWYDQGARQARQDATRTALVRLLKRRFGSLPDSYQQRIEAAEPEQLLQWIEVFVGARTLEDIFDDKG